MAAAPSWPKGKSPPAAFHQYSCWSCLESKSVSRSVTVAHQAPLSVEFSRQEYWSSRSLLQGIFLTQGWILDRLHCRQVLYSLSHQGSPTLTFYFWNYLVLTIPEPLRGERVLRCQLCCSWPSSLLALESNKNSRTITRQSWEYTGHAEIGQLCCHFLMCLHCLGQDPRHIPT